MAELRSARECAVLVAKALGGSTTPERILMPSRGRPLDVLARRLAAWAWRYQTTPPQTFTAAGAAFKRHRASVSSGEDALEPQQKAVIALWLWDGHPRQTARG